MMTIFNYSLEESRSILVYGVLRPAKKLLVSLSGDHTTNEATFFYEIIVVVTPIIIYNLNNNKNYDINIFNLKT